jgi:ribosomal protection tetracycline resistance protein
MVAGQIGKVWGLSDVQVGDGIGAASSLPAGAVAHEQQGSGYHTQLIAPVTDRRGAGRQFAPPTLETVIVPRRGGDGGRLHFALTQLAEQDPLINLRQDGSRQELSLSLYGEVQKEVIQETLASDYRVEVEFRESTTICIERPVGSGAAHEIIGKTPNQFAATVGLRVDPAPTGSRVAFRLEVELGSIPLSFHKAVEDTVRETLSQGLYGWEVTDCRVTMTHSGYWSPVSTAGDFRNLTPLVLMDALKRADTTVFEPMHRFRLEMPGDSYGPTVAALSRLEAAVCDATMLGSAWTLEGEIPAARVHELQQMLPGLTSGEGVVQCEFGRYRRIRGTPPTRSRSDQNPLNRKEYFLHVRRRV